MEPHTFPMLRDLTTDDIVAVWGGVSNYIFRELILDKAVRMEIGTFYLLNQDICMKDRDPLTVQQPVFVLSASYARPLGLRPVCEDISDLFQTVPLNPTLISLETRYPQHKVEACIRETLRIFSRVLADGKDADLVFKNIGVLVIRERRAKMRFYEDFLRTIDRTGYLLEYLLS
ncbi:coiled-coil domain-containing protein 81-like, partial [Nothoprocta perdicaria]|uniref:coiled-coil domain-containing protein 81-like n=1 Tax=Nothoprocta perdicaria TaxID=30464 RepID=UPI000E1C3F3B